MSLKDEEKNGFIMGEVILFESIILFFFRVIDREIVLFGIFYMCFLIMLLFI